MKTTRRGKTLFIIGSSRGIGLAIALQAAREGENKAGVSTPKILMKTC